MSLNFEGNGKPIAIVRSTGKKIKTTPLISVDSKVSSHHPFREYELTDENAIFQPIPDPNTERSILYVCGQSGSGKSFYTKKYAEEYKKMFPKRDIFLFSSIAEDSSIDEIKDLKRVKLSKNLLTDDITAEDFKDSLVIFDDTDCITDKPTRKKVEEILNSILETGRHYNVSCILTFHTANAGLATKKILNESHSITFFPATMGGRALKYLLDSYLGLDKKEISRVRKLKSRWVTIFKTYPKVVLSEKECYICTPEDD